MKMKHELGELVRNVTCSIHKLELKLAINKFKTNEEKVSIILLSADPAAFNSLKPIYHAAEARSDCSITIFVVPKPLDNGDFLPIDRGFYSKYENVIYSFDDNRKKWIDLKSIKPDYIIYDSPYYESFKNFPYRPSKVFKLAKLCYIPYGFILTKDENVLSYVLPSQFLVYLFVFFASWDFVGEYVRKRREWSGWKRIAYCGYPRFDLIDTDCNKEIISEETLSIMWTPRWPVPNSNAPQDKTTFMTYWKVLVNRAKEEKETWWFRPHPNALKQLINQGIVSRDELEQWISDINNMKNVSLDTSPDYIKTAEKADVLVTDFSSTIVEFLAMGKPIIYCGDLEAIPLDSLKKAMYIARDYNEIDKILKGIKKGNDYLKQERCVAINDLKLRETENIGKNILDYIVKDYKKK